MREISDEVLIHAVIYLMRWKSLDEATTTTTGLSWDNVYQRLAVVISVAEKFHGDGWDEEHNAKYGILCGILNAEVFNRMERYFLVYMDFKLYVTPELVCQIIHCSLHSSEIRIDDSSFLIIVLFYSSKNGVTTFSLAARYSPRNRFQSGR